MENTTETMRQEARITYEIATPKWLRDAADRHERAGSSVLALLYRNDALRIEEKLTL